MSALPEELRKKMETMLFPEEKKRIHIVRFGMMFRCSLEEGCAEPEDENILLLDEQGKQARLEKEQSRSLFLVRRQKEQGTFALYRFLPAGGTVSCHLPETITEIEEKAFCNCDILQKVEIPDSIRKIQDGAFWNCPKLAQIRIPDGTDYQIKTASDGSSYLFAQESKTVIRYLVQEKERTYISLPVGTMRVGRGAFSGAKDFRKVYPDRNLCWIGMGEFDGCRPGACYSGAPKGDCLCENRDGSVITWQEMKRR